MPRTIPTMPLRTITRDTTHESSGASCAAAGKCAAAKPSAAMVAAATKIEGARPRVILLRAQATRVMKKSLVRTSSPMPP
jgi:hypothetical protein